MIRSMTAYGRKVKTAKIGTITAEIWSVNRKHLDLKCLLPKELSGLEADIRSWITPQLARGYVTLKINVVYGDSYQLHLYPNLSLAKSYFDMRQKLESELNIVSDKSTWGEWLLDQEGVITKEDSTESSEQLKPLLEELIVDLIKPFNAMKEREGSALLADLMERLNLLKSAITSIEKQSSSMVNKYRQRLLNLLQELKLELASNDEVILREVALLADRSDINEEIARFKSHLNQIEHLLNGKEQHIGKTAEFILQEMMREVNTIGSKANEISISSDVIQMKSELERMREQIQNVE